MNNNNFCVIMAGGIGSRFWPLSRSSRPKQFLDILGVGKTLLQQTFERFLHICPTENIYIVTNAIYKEIVLEQLPNIKSEQVLLEPMRRNTAPCIAYANHKIAAKNPNANIIVAPSDHLILKEEEFVRVVKKGLKFTSENEALLTIGIKPSRPETGYGYIQAEEDGSNNKIKKTKIFTEKPNLKMAQMFVDSGDFFWNAGIFLWSMPTIMKAFNEHLPEVEELFKKGKKHYSTNSEETFINEIYPECKSISIDYGIMEKAQNVHVLCADFGWSDLGTWGSLYENSEKNENKNVITGKNVLTYDTNNCIIKISDEKLAVLQGLEDHIVVDANNILLICKKQEEQRIKEFVNDIKIEKGEDFI